MPEAREEFIHDPLSLTAGPVTNEKELEKSQKESMKDHLRCIPPRIPAKHAPTCPPGEGPGMRGQSPRDENVDGFALKMATF